jgi:hypothetical protein
VKAEEKRFTLKFASFNLLPSLLKVVQYTVAGAEEGIEKVCCA